MMMFVIIFVNNLKLLKFSKKNKYNGTMIYLVLMSLILKLAMKIMNRMTSINKMILISGITIYSVKKV